MGSTDTVLAQDLAALAQPDPLRALFANLGLTERLILRGESHIGRSTESAQFLGRRPRPFRGSTATLTVPLAQVGDASLPRYADGTEWRGTYAAAQDPDVGLRLHELLRDPGPCLPI